MLCCPMTYCWMLPFLPALFRLLLSLPIVGPVVRTVVGAVFPSLLERADAAGAAGAAKSCCPTTAWPKLESDEGRILSGEVVHLAGGVYGYVSAPKKSTGRAVIVVHDVFGIKGGRIRTVCDVLASEGFLAIMPDLYGDEDSVDNHGGLGSEECVAWLKSHAWGDMLARLSAAGGYASSHGVRCANALLRPPLNENNCAMVGFCWGAWVAAKASATGMVKAAVHVHPSWQVSSWLFNEPEVEMASRIRADTLLMPAGDDKDAYRDGTYAKVITANSGKAVSLVDFPKMRHGWVVRGSAADPDVMAEVERALREMAAFLHKTIPPIDEDEL